MRIARENYFETEVVGANRVGLVKLMYRAAQQAVAEAMVHVDNGDIVARGRAIARAQGILGELSAALDHELGGNISRTLATLYDYMLARLAAAHIEQRREPLGEVKRLLSTLGEAWEVVDDPNEPVADSTPYPEDSFLTYDPEPMVEYHGIRHLG